MQPAPDVRRGYFGSCALSLAIFAVFAGASAHGAETVLYSFKGGSDGAISYAGLIADKAGDLFGTTLGGGGGTDCADSGGQGCGTIFKLARNGNETVLHAFTGGCDGAYPVAALIADSAGNYYGTTWQGGICNSDDGYGTVFKLAADGMETVLYAFKAGSDGAAPLGSLIADKKGNLYGTTAFGGSGECNPSGCGTVFKLKPNGKETILHSFQGGSDGAEPGGGLIADRAGNFYGTTYIGGTGTGCGDDLGGCGTVFRITPNGAETVLYSFQGGCDGSNPTASLVMDGAGNLYGTTRYGGCVGTTDDGTVFKLAPDGTETVLYTFKAGSDGLAPAGSLIEDKAGNLYGTTIAGGSGCGGGACGIVFQIAPNGTETILHAFTGGSDGANPFAGLLAGKNGILYGTTQQGGASNDGVVFSVTK